MRSTLYPIFFRMNCIRYHHDRAASNMTLDGLLDETSRERGGRQKRIDYYTCLSSMLDYKHQFRKNRSTYAMTKLDMRPSCGNQPLRLSS